MRDFVLGLALSALAAVTVALLVVTMRPAMPDPPRHESVPPVIAAPPIIASPPPIIAAPRGPHRQVPPHRRRARRLQPPAQPQEQQRCSPLLCPQQTPTGSR